MYLFIVKEYLRTNVPDPGLEENYKKLRDKKMSREDQLNNKEIAKQEIGIIPVQFIILLLSKLAAVKEAESNISSGRDQGPTKKKKNVQHGQGHSQKSALGANDLSPSSHSITQKFSKNTRSGTLNTSSPWVKINYVSEVVVISARNILFWSNS